MNKTISVKFNENGIPYIPIIKESNLSFQLSEDMNTVKIVGNSRGLKLLAKALLGIATMKNDDNYHIHLDDLYNINEENKDFVIEKI